MKSKVGVLVGSLRKESFNRKIAKAMMELAPESLTLEFIEIGDLPYYNEDIEANAPAAWVNFRNKVKAVDALMFFTPEYNRSVPAVLKNAIDVGSRPYGQGVWNGKPGAVVSVSPGAVGGFGANHHLRQCLMAVDVPCMQQPEAYIGGVTKLLDEQGKLINEDTRKYLGQFMEKFAKWVENNKA